MKPVLILLTLLLLPGCALVQRVMPDLSEPDPAPVAVPQSELDDVLAVGSQTAESLDTANAEERAAAGATTADGVRALGQTVANLGDPAQAGFWLKTPLVDVETQGRVEYNGAAAAVTLIPVDGPASGGSRMSLSAMRLLNAPLSDLVEVQVFAL